MAHKISGAPRYRVWAPGWSAYVAAKPLVDPHTRGIIALSTTDDPAMAWVADHHGAQRAADLVDGELEQINSECHSADRI